MSHASLQIWWLIYETVRGCVWKRAALELDDLVTLRWPCTAWRPGCLSAGLGDERQTPKPTTGGLLIADL